MLLTIIKQILTVPGIDVIFIGPYDLSQSFGVTGNINAPIVQEAITKVINKTLFAGKKVGTVASNIEQAEKLIERGVNFLAVSSDYKMLGEMASKFIKEIRR